MRKHRSNSIIGMLFAFAIVVIGAAAGEAAGGPPAPRETKSRATATRAAVERGLSFLDTDAVKWRNEKKCASCHQGIMTVWALSEGKGQGHAVDDARLAEMTKWAKERLADIDKPRDSRPGFNMVNTSALFLAVMAKTNPTQTALSADEVARINGHLARHQEENGSWAWSLAPLQNRPPPVFESDEVATRLASICLGNAVSSKAGDWLALTPEENTLQAAAFRLIEIVLNDKQKTCLRGAIESIRARQNSDGGWSQVAGIASDGYATGQALYALRLAGVGKHDSVVRRGVGFLVSTQREDGSWAMTPRAHPGAKPMTNPSPITYFGSAWATMGLMRSAAR